MAMIPNLPLAGDIETRAVLKKLARAHQSLAELKGVAASMPDQSILVSTLSLQEAKDSSEIENIITTQDDIYRSDNASRHFITLAAKEVHNYAAALRAGFEQVRKTAAKYLEELVAIGLLSKHKLGKDNYYLNEDLYLLLQNVSQQART